MDEFLQFFYVLIGGFLLFMAGLVALLFWDEKKKREHELALAKARGTDKGKATPDSHEPIQQQTVIKEKEIIKEIVMIPCQHCGGLMPQTSVFCPNCGARRKS